MRNSAGTCSSCTMCIITHWLAEKQTIDKHCSVSEMQLTEKTSWLFNYEVVIPVAANWRDRGCELWYQRLQLHKATKETAIATLIILQPLIILHADSDPKLPACIKDESSLQQLWSAFETPSQMFWGLSVYYDCNMNQVRLFQLPNAISL